MTSRRIHHQYQTRSHRDLHHHVAPSAAHPARRKLRPNGRMINDVFKPVHTTPVEVDTVEVITITETIEPVVVEFTSTPMTKSIEHLGPEEKQAAMERAFNQAYRQLRSEAGIARVLPTRIVSIFMR